MITKSAENQSRFTEPLLFTRDARTAWGHIVQAAAADGPPVVLMPAYIGYTEREGSGVLDPVEAHAAVPRFYRVDDALRIDMDSLAQALAAGDVRIVLVIHYFGLCRNDMTGVQALCARHGAVLVEDCAHAFQLGVARQQLGHYGDFSFYSLHKYLATASGGALQVNSDRLTLAPLAPAQRIALEVMEQYARTDFGQVSAVRIANFAHYTAKLTARQGVQPMYALAPGEIPQSFPVRIKDGLREKLYFHLIERGIPVTALYYRLVDQITEAAFPVSFAISGEILNLPLHQDVTEQDVARVCAEIDAFFAARV